MERITKKMLEHKVQYLNKLTESPEATVTKHKDGMLTFNVGNFHLNSAYGGVNLVRVTNERGGVQDVFNDGHMTKRDLFNRIDALIAGIESRPSKPTPF